MSRRIASSAIRERKGAPFAVLTAYDAAFARLVEEAGVDCILVGDSVGMVVLGYESTAQVTLEDMCRHVAAVARGSATAHIIGDLPFGTYEASNEDAVRAATALVRAGAQSVKLEGGVTRAPRIRAIVDAGIPVVAHLGVLPQTAALHDGFKRKRDREALFADLSAVEKAGAFACVLEMVAHDIADEATMQTSMITIGIGSGTATDAQVLVMHDVLGLYHDSPPFAKRYADLASRSVDAFRSFAEDARGRQ